MRVFEKGALAASASEGALNGEWYFQDARLQKVEVAGEGSLRDQHYRPSRKFESGW